MGKCGSGNVNWVCSQLFGLADLLQSGYGTCFVRCSCLFEFVILLVKHWFSRKLYFSFEFETKSHNQNDRMDHGIISWFGYKIDFVLIFCIRTPLFVNDPLFSSFLCNCMKKLCQCIRQHASCVKNKKHVFF